MSRYETIRTIDEEMLERFSKALNVPVELIKIMEEEAHTIVIENNSITNNNDQAVGIQNYPTNNNTFNPVEKIVELYERILNDQQDKYAKLEDRVNKLTEKVDKQQ